MSNKTLNRGCAATGQPPVDWGGGVASLVGVVLQSACCRYVFPLLMLLLTGVAAHAQSGGTSKTIYIGMSAPLTGAQASYGTALEKGLKLEFAQQNANGGIGGRRIELIVRDDAGDPKKALANTQELLDAGVLAFTGYHGSRAIEAALPAIINSGTPLIGVASSAEFLREPPSKLVFNLRAGAREEIWATLTHLDTLGVSDIAVITQLDALGAAIHEGMRVELARFGMRPQALMQMPINASATELARVVEQACKEKPKALVLGMGSATVLSVVRAARTLNCAPQFYIMSEAGAELLASSGVAAELAGVVVSQVLPHPRSPSIMVAVDYARQAGASATYAGLEGFISARVISEALGRCSSNLTRLCLVNALEARAVDVGGYKVEFRPNERRGSRFVEMTIITADGRFRR